MISRVLLVTADGVALSQVQLTGCGHLIDPHLIPIESTHQQPETNRVG